MALPVYLLEGAWDTTHESPLVLPYFLAYSQSHREVEIYHRTFRTADDIAYYVKKIKKNSKSFVYFACHGEPGYLLPTDKRNRLDLESISSALGVAKARSSIGFLHFSCCSFVRHASRRKPLHALAKSSGADWVSGYINDVDWLQSILFDLALVSEVYYACSGEPCRKTIARNISDFMSNYEQLSRSLGFSALSQVTPKNQMLPARQRVET